MIYHLTETQGQYNGFNIIDAHVNSDDDGALRVAVHFWKRL